MTKVEKNADLKREIINLLHQHFEELVQNPYGNYAIQHAFDVHPRDCNIIFERVVEKIVQYSNQKFSSNVVEKCISIGPMVTISTIKHILLTF
jgi:pumilio RNA-binding family